MSPLLAIGVRVGDHLSATETWSLLLMYRFESATPEKAELLPYW